MASHIHHDRGKKKCFTENVTICQPLQSPLWLYEKKDACSIKWMLATRDKNQHMAVDCEAPKS